MFFILLSRDYDRQNGFFKPYATISSELLSEKTQSIPNLGSMCFFIAQSIWSYNYFLTDSENANKIKHFKKEIQSFFKKLHTEVSKIILSPK